jgi:hypothetical protein
VAAAEQFLDAKDDMRLDLQADQRKLRRYIERRIRDYPVYVNLGPGDDGDPIGLVTVGFYAEQGGYVNLVFDTRPDAEVDGQWTVHIDNDTNTLAFPKWLSAYEAICNGETVSVTRHDGSAATLQDSDGDEGVNRIFGEMIVDLMLQLRDDGTLAKLPLAPKAFLVVEEFDGRYFWPTHKTRKTKGRILK